MGRGATVASGNVWYEARIEASKTNDKLRSRFGAADEAGMSEDAIKNTELGLEKQMPVDKAVILADLYGAPQLLNYYCLNECPIGNKRPLSDKVLSIERVTVKLLKKLRIEQLDQVKDKLIDIASDGEITYGEEADLEEALRYLESLSRTISELRIIGERITGHDKK